MQLQCGVFVFYDAPTPPPGMFDTFLAIPSLQKNVSTRSYLSFVQSPPDATGTRYAFEPFFFPLFFCGINDLPVIYSMRFHLSLLLLHSWMPLWTKLLYALQRTFAIIYWLMLFPTSSGRRSSAPKAPYSSHTLSSPFFLQFTRTTRIQPHTHPYDHWASSPTTSISRGRMKHLMMIFTKRLGPVLKR